MTTATEHPLPLPTWQNLTPRQRDVLHFAMQYSGKHGYMPTMQEIADGLGKGRVTVFEQVKELKRRGALYRAKKGVSRGLRIAPAYDPNSVSRKRRREQAADESMVEIEAAMRDESDPRPRIAEAVRKWETAGRSIILEKR
ncbi:MAG TPA: hypothetical protein VHY37_06240 [Tepidisphaeraceae bacterium]|jgi:SOS-response transcriptional repressor LexA|nr:hypothetical protein [Tepidisphaeraceae bacterium]